MMWPLSHRIYLLGQAMGAAANSLLRAEFNLGFSEYLVLHGVGNKQLTSQAQLAGFVGVGDAGVSRIVTRSYRADYSPRGTIQRIDVAAC